MRDARRHIQCALPQQMGVAVTRGVSRRSPTPDNGARDRFGRSAGPQHRKGSPFGAPDPQPALTWTRRATLFERLPQHRAVRLGRLYTGTSQRCICRLAAASRTRGETRPKVRGLGSAKRRSIQGVGQVRPEPRLHSVSPRLLGGLGVRLSPVSRVKTLRQEETAPATGGRLDCWSGHWDSNPGPPRPERGALPNFPGRSGEKKRPPNMWGPSFSLVGEPGFEPGTSCTQGRRAAKLRYSPIEPTRGRRAVMYTPATQGRRAAELRHSPIKPTCGHCAVM